MQGWQTRPVAGTPSREFLHDPPLSEAMHPALTLRARKKPLPMVGAALLRQVPGYQVRHAVYAGAATLHQRPHFAAVVGGGSLGRPQWSASAGQGMVLALALASGSALPRGSTTRLFHQGPRPARLHSDPVVVSSVRTLCAASTGIKHHTAGFYSTVRK